MTKQRAIWLTVVITFTVVVLAIVSIPVFRHSYGVSDTLHWLLTIGENATHFGPTYSEAAFSRISVGMSEQNVLAILGAPLDRRSLKTTNDHWRYSTPATPSGHYHWRCVTFSKDGKVTEVHKGFYLD